MPSKVSRSRKHREKYRAIEKLVIDIDQKERSPLNLQYIKMSQALAAFNILRVDAKIHEAAKIAKDICKTGNKYSFPKFVVEPASFLFQYYSQYEFNRTKALRMKNLHKTNFQALDIEMQISCFYSDLLLAERSKHSKNNIGMLAEEYWHRTKSQLFQIRSFEFHKFCFLIGIINYRSKSDWKSIESLSHEAISYFESFPLKSSPIISIFYRQLINSLLIQGKHGGINELLSSYKVLVSKSPINWINYQYTLARIKAIQLDLSDIPIITNEVKSVKGYTTIPKMNQLAWDILQCYTSYMNLNTDNPNDKISLPNNVANAKEEDMLTDQYKIQLLIIRLIYFVLNEEWQRVESNSAAISKYLNRKLVREGQSRSFNFIKMLLQLPERRYHHVAIKRHTNNYYKKLIAEPSNAIGSQQDYEIIPYEHLWEMIMVNLKK